MTLNVLISMMYRNTKSKNMFWWYWYWLDQFGKGVKQEWVSSPILFSIYSYTEELAARIRNIGLGVKVNEGGMGSILYADDVVCWLKKIIWCSKIWLLLNIVRTYGSEFSLSFNSNKHGVLIFNKPEEEIEDFKLGKQITKRIRKYGYPGFLFW